MDAITPSSAVSWSYAELEAALASTLRIDLGKLKGRVAYLRGIGFCPPGAGKGHKVRYDLDWSARWFLAMHLSAVACMDVGDVVRLLTEQWEPRTPADGPMLGELVHRALTAWDAKDHILLVIRSRPGVVLTAGHVRACELSTLAPYLADWQGSVTIVDLSAQLRRLVEALDDGSPSFNSLLA